MKLIDARLVVSPKALVSPICSDRQTPTLTLLLRQLLRSRTRADIGLCTRQASNKILRGKPSQQGESSTPTVTCSVPPKSEFAAFLEILRARRLWYQTRTCACSLLDCQWILLRYCDRVITWSRCWMTMAGRVVFWKRKFPPPELYINAATHVSLFVTPTANANFQAQVAAFNCSPQRMQAVITLSHMSDTQTHKDALKIWIMELRREKRMYQSNSDLETST